MSVAHVTPQRQPPADLLTAYEGVGHTRKIDLSVSLTDFAENTDIVRLHRHRTTTAEPTVEQHVPR